DGTAGDGPIPTGEAMEEPRGGAPRRGPARQRDRRQREHKARRQAAEAGRTLFDLGWAWDRIADLLRVAGRTLRQWCRDLLDRWKPVLPLGRPAARSPRAARETVIAFLDEHGPGVGVPTLRPCFPAMRRAERADLVRRYRRGWRRRKRGPPLVLGWAGPRRGGGY